MAENEADISSLIAQVMQNPNETLSRGGDHRASSQLAELGALAVRPILKAMRGPFPAGQHPVEVVEALGSVLSDIARRDSGPLVEVLNENAAPPEPGLFFVVSALEHSDDERAVEALIRTLRHPDKMIRYGAASALVKKKGKEVVAALIKALGDRSSLVKFTVVEGMKQRADLRDARALRPLRRIVESKSLQRNSPGLCDYAREVIGEIEGKGQ